MRAPLSKVLSHAFVVGFALATGETAWALPKNHCVLPPPASSVVPYRRRSTASATASPIARTRFPLNAGLGNDPINRDFDARSCVNNWPHESIASSELGECDGPACPAACVDRGTQPALRLWTGTQFSTIPVALIFDGRRHLLAMVLGSPTPADRGSSAQGRLQWPKS